MSRTHHCTLHRSQVETLPAVRHERRVTVQQGWLWLTRADSHGGRDDDIWLAAGQSHRLPAGTRWLLQGWPQARLVLQPVKPPSQPGRGVAALLSAWRLPRTA